MPHVSPPTMAVESSTPTVAKTATETLCRLNCSRSMWREPAKSKNPSIPCSRASLRSIPPTKAWAH